MLKGCRQTQVSSYHDYCLEHRFFEADQFLELLVWAGPDMTIHIQMLVMHAITHVRIFTVMVMHPIIDFRKSQPLQQQQPIVT